MPLNEIEKQLQVMVVDDDEDAREILELTLMKNHYAVQSCVSGREAISAVTAETRVVILDIMMPGMDGSETYLGLQKLYPGLPVIFYSAYQTVVDQRKLGKYKPLAYVDKGAPDSRQRLLNLIQQAAPGNAG